MGTGKSIDSWSMLAQDLLRALRGERPQKDLNTALGFSFNQVHRWETGRKRILWAEFVHLCSACGAPLRSVCEEHLLFHGNLYRGDRLLQAMVLAEDIEVFAKQYNLSKQIVQRWRSGKSELTLDGALCAFDFRMSSVVPFVAKLVNIDKFAFLQERFNTETKYKQLITDHPAMAVLMTVLHFEDVRVAKVHSIKLLQKYLPIEERYLQTLIKLGTQSGLLRKAAGRLEIGNYSVFFNDPGRRLLFYKYWTQRAVEVQQKIDKENINNVFPTLVVTTNAEMRRKIHEILAEVRMTIGTLVKQDVPLDGTSIIQLSCFTPINLPEP